MYLSLCPLYHADRSDILHKILASLLKGMESRAISEAVIFAFIVYSHSH